MVVGGGAAEVGTRLGERRLCNELQAKIGGVGRQRTSFGFSLRRFFGSRRKGIK